MEEIDLLIYLEEIVRKLNIKIEYDEEIDEGGLCKINNQYLIVINKNLPVNKKVEIITEALTEFELDKMYILPYVREFIKCSPSRKDFFDTR